MSTKVAARPSSSTARGPLGTLRNELEEWFSNVIPEFGEGWLPSRMMPSLDLSETDGAVEVRMDVPGIDPEKLDIEITGGNVLNVRGEKKEEKEEKGRTYHRLERRTGSFARSVALPCDVTEEKARAEYHDGVLTVKMPKVEAARAKKINVSK